MLSVLCRRAEEAENIPISLDANNVNDKEGDILSQIRTCPPSPQCFSVGRAPSKATPLKASRSRPSEYKVLPMNYKAYGVLPVGVKESSQSMVGFVGAVFASVFPIYRLISV